MRGAIARSRSPCPCSTAPRPPDWGVDQPLGYSGSPGAIPRTLKETEHLPTATFDRIAAFLDAARRAVGPDVELAVDCHGRLNVANARRLCRALEPFRLMFLEEPVPPENPEALAAVTRDSPIPIAAGERWATIHGVLPFLKAGAVHLLQCDVANCGGLTQARKIAALAEAYGIGLAPHNPNGPLATAASVQLAASIPNFTMLETIGGPEDDALSHSVVPRRCVPTKATCLCPPDRDWAWNCSIRSGRSGPTASFGVGGERRGARAPPLEGSSERPSSPPVG